MSHREHGEHGERSTRKVRQARDNAPVGIPLRLCDASDLLVPSVCLISSCALPVFVVFLSSVLSVFSVVRNLLLSGQALLPVLDAVCLYDLVGAGFGCRNLPRFEIFSAECWALVS